MSIVDMRKTQPLDSQIYYINMSFDQFMGYVREYIDGLDDQFPATLFEVGQGGRERWLQLQRGWEYGNVLIQEVANPDWVAIIDPYIDHTMSYFSEINQPNYVLLGAGSTMYSGVQKISDADGFGMPQTFSVIACAIFLEDPFFPAHGRLRPTFLSCSWGTHVEAGWLLAEQSRFYDDVRRSLWASNELGTQGLTKFAVNLWPEKEKTFGRKTYNHLDLDWNGWGPDPTFRPDPQRPVYEWFNHRVVDGWGKNLGLEVFDTKFHVGRQAIFKELQRKDNSYINAPLLYEDFRPFEERQKMMGFSPDHMQWLVDQGLY
ncbi:hypothetical protein [Corynebacterium ulcerans]|uniref:hypothetical protein n=1 Tax=Corynebacterium ulcerans TaxID=65058 RepID=UPI001F52D6F8|nr:hypothetical protein [Corynebacterium ulcerans]